MAYAIRLNSRLFANARRSFTASYLTHGCQQVSGGTTNVGNWPNLYLQKSYSSSTQSDAQLILPDISPNAFAKRLNEKGINRVYWVTSPKERTVSCSHPDFAQFGSIFGKGDRDYNDHEGIFLEVGKRTNALLGAFIWRSNRGQAVSIDIFSLARPKKV